MSDLSELDLGSKRLRPYQCELIEKVRGEIRKGRRRIIINAPTGAGKCLGKGTPVLMFDGSIKAVEDVKQGDSLMGPDSGPRQVLSTCAGTEMLYRVTPVKGDSYVVNESHVLSLRRTSDGKSGRGGEIVNVCVTDYLKSSKTFKHMHKGWRTGVDFPGNPTLPLDPYYLGLWLADGTSQNTSITTPDKEIVRWLDEYAGAFGLSTRVEYNSENSVIVHITSGVKGGADPKRNQVLNFLKDMGLIGNKHIPLVYKTAARDDRLRLLAGYLDGDGYLSRGSFDCISVREGLMDDILFVARSLGFSAYKQKCQKTCCNTGVTGTYWRGSIGGDLDRIPCTVPRRKAPPRKQKKSVLVTGISVQPMGPGEYFGFEIDGDGLFLLGDFTVTHNTTITCGIIKLSAMKGSLSMFMAPRRELLRQTADHLIDCDVKYSFIAAGMGEQMAGSECLVVSKDTLHSRAMRRSKIPIPTTNVLAIDEAHLSLAPRFLALMLEIEKQNPNMITLGLSATPGRADGKGLGDFWESIVTAAGYEELRELGFLVPARVFLGHAPDMKGVRSVDWESEAAKRVDKPKLVGDIVENWLKYASDRKTFVFGATQSHATHLRDEFLKAGIRAAHVDDTTPPEERAQAFDDLRSGVIQVLTNVEICTYGIDVPEVSCVVLASPCRSLVRYRQRCGRALRPFEGKQDCIARGSLVLTQLGLVEIQDITLDHKVWDGVRFVSHGGAVCRGVQSVMSYDGLTATPDHRVMTNEGWKSLSEAASGQLRIIKSGSGRCPVRVTDHRFTQDAGTPMELVGRSPVCGLRNCLHESIPQHAQAAKYKGVSKMYPTSACESSKVAISTMSVTTGQVPKQGVLFVPSIRCPWNRVQVFKPKRSRSMDCGQSWNSWERLDNRQDRQYGALRTGQLAMVQQCPTTEQYQEKSRITGTICQFPSKSPRDSVCRHNSSAFDLVADDRRRNNRSLEPSVIQAKREVWDILNAGPLQRFTANDCLVHNCIVLDHAGGVVMHGFPDEDIEWPLEKSRSIDQEYQKKRKEGGTKEPIICTTCGCAYSGMPVCPNCGSRQSRQGRAIAVERGLLKEIKREKKKPVVNSFEQKQKYWNQCLAVMARKGRTCGAAARMYSRAIGSPPWCTKGLQRLPRNQDWKLPVSQVFPNFAPTVQNEPK